MGSEKYELEETSDAMVFEFRISPFGGVKRLKIFGVRLKKISNTMSS